MQMLSWFNPFDEKHSRTPEDLGYGPPGSMGQLHNAALWNDTKKIKELLVSGHAHVNELAPGSKDTALMWAAQEGHIETVRLLLEHGAKTNMKDANGRTALEIATRMQHSGVMNDLESERKKEERRARKIAEAKKRREEERLAEKEDKEKERREMSDIEKATLEELRLELTSARVRAVLWQA